MIQLYTYTFGNIVNTIMTNEHASWEKYTSHFIRKGCERVICERWIGDWTKTAAYWPPVPLSLAAFLSLSAGLLNRGPWEPDSLLGLVLTASNCNKWLQTKWTSSHTGLYNCLMFTCFLWASNLHAIQPVYSQGYTQISSTGCTSSLIDGWVGGQYATNRTADTWNIISEFPLVFLDSLL